MKENATRVKYHEMHGFTLIELLIVVAIIAILAAIAVPNFLEAQVRAKVSRVKNDMRTIDVGLTAYRIDNNKYPYPNPNLGNGYEMSLITGAVELSTPVAYLTSVMMLDPFGANWAGYGSSGKMPYSYVSYEGFFYDQYVNAGWIEPKPKSAWCLISWGPDRAPGSLVVSVWDGPSPSVWKASPFVYNRTYDPTNGTISGGDIGRFGGEALTLGLPTW